MDNQPLVPVKRVAISIRELTAYLLFLLITRKTAFYALMIALVGGGLALIYLAKHIASALPFLHPTVVEEAGKAFMVAGLLSGTVDLYLKRRMTLDCVRDLSPFIEGIGLPREFQDEISFLRRTNVYRVDFELFYRIIPIPNQSGYCSIYVSISYHLVNQFDQPYISSHRLFCEHEYPSIGKSRILSAGGRGKNINSYWYVRDSADRPFPADALKETDVGESFGKDTMIPPNKTTYADDPIKFWGEMVSISEENDADIFYIALPTVSPTIRVEYPDNFNVEVYIGHRFQDLPETQLAEKISQIPPPPGKTHTWTLSAGLVTWQSIFIRWQKKRTPLKQSPEGGS